VSPKDRNYKDLSEDDRDDIDDEDATTDNSSAERNANNNFTFFDPSGDSGKPLD